MTWAAKASAHIRTSARLQGVLVGARGLIEGGRPTLGQSSRHQSAQSVAGRDATNGPVRLAERRQAGCGNPPGDVRWDLCAGQLGRSFREPSASNSMASTSLCCDATLVSPLTRTGQPQPGATETRVSAPYGRTPQTRHLSRTAPSWTPTPPRAGIRSRRALEWRGRRGALYGISCEYARTGPRPPSGSRRCGVVQALVEYAGSRSPASGRRHGPWLRVAGTTARPSASCGAEPTPSERREGQHRQPETCFRPLHLWMVVPSGSLAALLSASGQHVYARPDAGRRLGTTGSMALASAKGGSGNSSSDIAKALGSDSQHPCPLISVVLSHRRTQTHGHSARLCSRTNPEASWPIRPPTSKPSIFFGGPFFELLLAVCPRLSRYGHN